MMVGDWTVYIPYMSDWSGAIILEGATHNLAHSRPKVVNSLDI